jgi:hypothetical protein
MLTHMHKSIHARFARALLAAMLAGAAGAACAAPIYHVTVDTGAWSGNGYLDLTLAGLENTPAVTATVSNFRGSFGTARWTQGQVAGDVASGVTLVQGPSFNELLQQIGFGGVFGFDVSFAGLQGVPNGSNFDVALVDAGLTGYAAGTDGDIATIALTPGAPTTWLADARYVRIAEVPEPGSAALVGMGLLLVSWRRKRAGGRTAQG